MTANGQIRLLSLRCLARKWNRRLKWRRKRCGTSLAEVIEDQTCPLSAPAADRFLSRSVTALTYCVFAVRRYAMCMRVFVSMCTMYTTETYTNYLLSSGTNVFIYCRFPQTVKSSVMFLVALGPRVTYYAVTPFGSLLQLCDVQLCINTIRLILSVLWRRSLYASQIVWFIYLSRGWRGVSINIFKIFSPKFIHWVKWKKLCTDSRLVNIQIFTITNRRVWPNLWGSQDHPLHAFNPAAWRRFKYLPFMVSAVMSLRFKHPRF